MTKVLQTILKQKTTWILIGIVILAAFMRLYRISDYMTFLGDEGRDVLIAKSIIEGNLTFLGPRSSAGDFFLGPAYYYMITPFLWLFKLDPVGPAVMVALVSVATVVLIYIVAKKFFDTRAALFAAALYAVSPLVLRYSHSSWNPNVLPFFALLMLYMTFKAIASARPWKYFLFSGFLLGINMQLHYLAIFLAIIMFLYIFFAEWLMNNRIKLFETIKHYLLVLVGFLIGFSPFIAFEVRHGFPNTQAIFGFIFKDTLTKQSEIGASYTGIITDVFFRIFARLLFDFPTPDKLMNFPLLTLQFWGLLAMILSIAAIVYLFLSKNKFVILLLGLWLFLSVIFFGFYKKEIYDYLFTFIFPLPFLLMGNLMSRIYGLGAGSKRKYIGTVASLILFIGMFSFLLSHHPFQNEPNRQRNQVKTIAEFVIDQTDNKPYNFALISGGNSDHAYRYYLEILGHKPVVIDNDMNDPQRKTVTDQLLVVCEDIPCKPLGNPLFDVAAFGRGAIVKDSNVSVVKVYRLIHYTERTEAK
jgi:4-amino-4-deoxy-L-arabinose transferase-like glycosyltransferase